MEITCSLRRFKPWGGAVAVFEKIEMANKLSALEEYLEEIYGPTMEGGQLNDLLAYDNEQLLINLGLEQPEEVELEECFISKLNEKLEAALNEDQYENDYTDEEVYKVTLENKETFKVFQYDYDLQDENGYCFAELHDISDWEEVAEEICDYVNKKGLSSVIKIVDGINQVVYEV